MEKTVNQLTERILKKITPKKEEYTKIETLSSELEQKIAAACQQEGIAATVRVEGSIAKDTWLSGNPDIDVFMRLPTSIPRKNLGDIGLKIAKKAAGNAKQIERFAEHPYLQIFIDGYRIDIVPCYNAKPGEWQSATDRTPYHTDYIRDKQSKPMRGEVRLLKKFMQGVGVYGAEIKVGGFSGYLCELLVLEFSSFMDIIEAFAHYNQRLIVDLEGVYASREHELSLLFPEPLVIVDPVDKGRNVASAVQPQKLYSFVGAARAFLEKPGEEFFYPPKPSFLSTRALRHQLGERGSTVMFLVIGELNAVPDVLWGQLYRTKRSLRTLVETNDFRVLKDAVWSNEKSLSTFLFEMEQQVLPNIKKHLGPPLEREAECEKFLSKYCESDFVISGPYIEDGRWIVELPRKNIDAAVLLKEKLADGGKNAGVADLIACAVKKKFSILLDDEVLEFYGENEDFALFLTSFLLGKPFWLKSSE
jgi:tRNA nucleotidyltransferase (CCA-adding enzyme)